MAHNEEDQEFLDKMRSSGDNTTEDDSFKDSITKEVTISVMVSGLLLILVIIIWRKWNVRIRQYALQLITFNFRRSSSAVNLQVLTYAGPKKPSGEAISTSELEQMVDVQVLQPNVPSQGASIGGSRSSAGSGGGGGDSGGAVGGRGGAVGGRGGAVGGRGGGHDGAEGKSGKPSSPKSQKPPVRKRAPVTDLTSEDNV